MAKNGRLAESVAQIAKEMDITAAQVARLESLLREGVAGERY